jgi:uncharacterized membrane protein
MLLLAIIISIIVLKIQVPEGSGLMELKPMINEKQQS